jgi:hypothetical protein
MQELLDEDKRLEEQESISKREVHQYARRHKAGFVREGTGEARKNMYERRLVCQYHAGRCKAEKEAVEK